MMKIAIGNLQSPDLFTEVDSSAGECIVGGESIEASFDVSSSGKFTDSTAEARGSGSIFGLGDKVRGSLMANIRTSEDSSRILVGAFTASGQ